MATDKFPFVYDADKVQEFFASVKFPFFDMETVMEAQKKNLDAVIAANQAVMTGYQEIARRQAELAEAALKEVGETFTQLKDKPLSPEAIDVEAVAKNSEKALSAAIELSTLAQKANLEAFEIVRNRFAEAMDEVRAATEKAAA